MNEMNNVSEDIIQKIAKLLRLGNNNSNEHESSLALAKAKQLAAEHEIDVALVEIFTKVKKDAPEIIKNTIDLNQKRKSVTQKFVSWIIQEHFGCKIINSGGRNQGVFIAIIGTKEKVAIAEFVNSFLNSEFSRLWLRYYESNNCVLAEKMTYLLGLYRGLSQKLTDEQNKVESEKLTNQSQETQNQWGLMVISEKDRLDEAVGQFFPSLKKAAKFTLKNYSENTYVNGVIAGKSINIKLAISNGCVNNLVSA